ncbi:MAG TPA: MoaD/ThiS family protein [Pyrinomonadaceae bacterium]|mgnify:CR=1 FL=1|nr:MoaD/ThiS family protein [Pyrinomonadaceae bacterium]
MAVTLLFFGATADAVGKREIKIELGDGATVGQVLGNITQTHPGLGVHKLLIALNEEYVSLDTSVKDGDTLAIFTAVSGG